MAIDSSLFAADIAAGTYAVGDSIQMGCISGPANVRSGRGAALLKRIVTGCGISTTTTARFRIHVKNSDWIDDVMNIAASSTAPTALSKESGMVQKGHNCNLTQNSSWTVWAECIRAGTTTAAMSIWSIIDIDYPDVASVIEPGKLDGTPTTIQYDKASVPFIADGTLTAASWQVENVDYFKAGFAYCLDKIELLCQPTAYGFVAFSNAAGMGGLTRIIPITDSAVATRYAVEYASVLRKGPMDIKTLYIAASATTADVQMCHDYVKKRA